MHETLPLLLFLSALFSTLAFATATLIRIRIRTYKTDPQAHPRTPHQNSREKASSNSDPNPLIHHLRSLQTQHELPALMTRLIDEDGAGAWPPNANHHREEWPPALRPYQDIYFELLPLLSTGEVSLDDAVNRERRGRYRGSMGRLLAEQVSVPDVEEIMGAVERGDWGRVSREAYNGFYCCVAVCRHAFRWATIPVVKVAQLERVVQFPRELDVPWRYLQRRFGVDADAGNNTSNVLLNFDTRGERIYRINVGMSDVIQSSEEVFFRMFYDLEVAALPIYHAMILAIHTYSTSPLNTLAHLRTLTTHLRPLLQIFYTNLTHRHVSPTIWLSYIQGFQGWGVGKYHPRTGTYIKYDGLSGNHVLIFQALDAFLGMDRYLSDENMLRYIPVRQRELCDALRRCSFVERAKRDGEREIVDEVTEVVRLLKVFRAAHRARVMTYLREPAPERLPMTAGKSVLGGGGVGMEEALKPLDEMLVRRLTETGRVCGGRVGVVE